MFNKQELLEFAIISLTLVTLMFDSEVILLGEIRFLQLLKGLRIKPVLLDEVLIMHLYSREWQLKQLNAKGLRVVKRLCYRVTFFHNVYLWRDYQEEDSLHHPWNI